MLGFRGPGLEFLDGGHSVESSLFVLGELLLDRVPDRLRGRDAALFREVVDHGPHAEIVDDEWRHEASLKGRQRVGIGEQLVGQVGLKVATGWFVKRE